MEVHLTLGTQRLLDLNDKKVEMTASGVSVRRITDPVSRTTLNYGRTGL